MHSSSLFLFLSVSGELDLWCTSSQFWEIGAGDEEEHAVTLFNYLHYLFLKRANVIVNSSASANNNNSNNNNNIDASTGASNNNNNKSKQHNMDSMSEVLKEGVFLVMGRAVPEGDSVYVMIRDHKRSATGVGPENFLIINPWTGYIYSAIDPNCPLRDVYLLATPNNIWANIQVPLLPLLVFWLVFNPS